MTNPAVGDEKYLRGDANTDGSIRVLVVADSNGDGLPDGKLQWRYDGRWLDLANVSPIPASSVVRTDGLTAQQVFDSLAGGGAGGGAASTVTNDSGVGGATVKAALDALAAVDVTKADATATTAALAGKLASTLLGTASGVAQLDSGGRLPSAQLPSGVAGGLHYKGTWNATTNTPALASGVGTDGDYYVVSTAGSTTLDTISSWAIGDQVLFSTSAGSKWQKVGAGQAITSVYGRTTAAIVATAGDYNTDQVTRTKTRTNFTPAAATAEGDIAGIDTKLGALSTGGLTSAVSTATQAGSPATSLTTSQAQIGNTVTVTPKSTLSKVHLVARLDLSKDATTTARTVTVRAWRGAVGSGVQVGQDAIVSSITTSGKFQVVLLEIDAPATTSATSYNISAACDTGAVVTVARYEFQAAELLQGGYDQTTPIDWTGGATGAVARTAVAKGGDTVSAKDFNAKGDGSTDDTAALQAAITYARTNSRRLWIPAGTYKITDRLIATPPNNGGYGTVEIVGDGGGYATGASRTIIDATALTNKPALTIDSARRPIIKGIMILGGNVAPTTALAVSTGPTDVQADYVTGGLRDAQYSPHAGIAIDCIQGSTPADGGYTGITYPGFQSASGGIVLQDVMIRNFVVGIAHSLAAGIANGDTCTFTDVSITGCATCYAVGGSQVRDVNFFGGSLTVARTLIDCTQYGDKTGDFPNLFGLNFGSCVRVFRAYTDLVNAKAITSCYFESIKYLGDWGLYGASAQAPLSFVGCTIKTRSVGTWLPWPYLIQNYGAVAFRECLIRDNIANQYAINLAYSFNSPVTFEGCNLALQADPRAQVGWVQDWQCGALSIRRCRHQGYAEDLDDSPINYGYTFADRVNVTRGMGIITDGWGNNYKVSRAALGANHASIGTISNVVWSGASMHFDATSITYLIVGDLIPAKCKAVGNSDNAGSQFVLPLLRVTGIAGSTVTCSYLCDPALIDQTYTSFRLVYHLWAANAAGLTCTTVNTSTGLTAVSPTDILRVGDWVKGSGIPANTRVTAVSGSTATLSQAATASASGVALSFAALTAL